VIKINKKDEKYYSLCGEGPMEEFMAEVLPPEDLKTTFDSCEEELAAIPEIVPEEVKELMVEEIRKKWGK